MTTVKKGNTISVNYTGKFEDGEVFDTSLNEGREPLRTVLGHGNLIPGFEKGIIGMKVGESKVVEIEATEAYGEYLDGLVNVVPKDQVPPETKVGDVLQSKSDRGVLNVQVKEITEAGIKLDANHPLAGKKLIFEIELLEIV